MTRRIDIRSFAMMLVAIAIGVAWAWYNYSSTGGARGESQLRPLVWTIFSTPFFFFIGWVIARWSELWRAAFTCFCLYFFTPFVAARIESLFMDTKEAAHSGHHLYFTMVMVLHAIVAVGLAIWRALQPYDTHERLHTETTSLPMEGTST